MSENNKMNVKNIFLEVADLVFTIHDDKTIDELRSSLIHNNMDEIASLTYRELAILNAIKDKERGFDKDKYLENIYKLQNDGRKNLDKILDSLS